MTEDLTGISFSSATAGLGGVALFSLSRSLTANNQKKKCPMQQQY